MSPTTPNKNNATVHQTLTEAKAALVEARAREAKKKSQPTTSEAPARKPEDISLVPPSSTKKPTVGASIEKLKTLPKPRNIAGSFTSGTDIPNPAKETRLKKATVARPNGLTTDDSDSNEFVSPASAEEKQCEKMSKSELLKFIGNINAELQLRTALSRKSSSPADAAKAAEATNEDTNPSAHKAPVINQPANVRHSEEPSQLQSKPDENSDAASLADDMTIAELAKQIDEVDAAIAAEASLSHSPPLGEHLQQLRKQWLPKIKFPDFLPSLVDATKSLPKPIQDEVSRAAKALFEATAKVTASDLVLERYAAQPDLIPSGARIKFGITTQYANISADEPVLIKIREELAGCITDFHVNARRLVLAKVKFEKEFFTKQKVVQFLRCMHTLANQELTTWLLRNDSVLRDPYAITNDKRKIVGQIIYSLLHDITMLPPSVITYLGMDRQQIKAILQAGWYRRPQFHVPYELANSHSLLTSKDNECIAIICKSMKLYVEPMTAGIDKLYNDAVSEKVLDAHLRAQTAQLNVNQAAKATQAALDNTKPLPASDMTTYIQQAIQAGIKEAVKNLSSPAKNSQGHAKAQAVEPNGNSKKRYKGKGNGNNRKEIQSPEPSNKRVRINSPKDNNNSPKAQDKKPTNNNRKRPNNKGRYGKKGPNRQDAAKDAEA